MLLALAADRAEVLVDAEHDQDELGADAGEDHADQGDQYAGDHGEHAGDRVHQHEPQSAEDGLQAGQHRHGDREPIEDLDDRWRDEAFPLKKVANVEHAALLSTPSGVTRTDPLVTNSFTPAKPCAGVGGEMMSTGWYHRRLTSAGRGA